MAQVLTTALLIIITIISFVNEQPTVIFLISFLVKKSNYRTYLQPQADNQVIRQICKVLYRFYVVDKNF